MNVAFFSTKSYDREFFDKANENYAYRFVYFEASLNSETVSLAQGFDAVCIFVNDVANRAVIEQLWKNGVKLIALRCAGFNNVDIAAATTSKIVVARVPAYSPEAIAEHAVALILTLNRKTHKAYNRIRENNFSLERLTGFNLSGKTVGVIGTGKTGAAFCRIMLGFGCKVIATDKVVSAGLKTLGVTYTSIDSLLAQSDIISLHCPLTTETKHLLNKARFDMMKDGVMIINTSRGAVINTKDAIEALKTGKLGYLGLDVYEQEENLFFKDLSEHVLQDDTIARLMSFPNVLVTAHQGFFTKEALGEIAATTLQNLADFKNGIFNTNMVT